MKCKACNQDIKKYRTSKQSRAMHLFFSQLADVMTEAGLDIRTTLKSDFDLPWSPELVKELLWKPVMKAYKKINSTTKLESKDIDKIYDIINRQLGEKHGLELPPFPSIESLIEQEENYES